MRRGAHGHGRGAELRLPACPLPRHDGPAHRGFHMFPLEPGLREEVVYTEDAIPADGFRPPAPAATPLGAAPAPALPADKAEPAPARAPPGPRPSPPGAELCV